MTDESNLLPTSRVVRWITLGALIALAVALYFRDGRNLSPLTAPPLPPPSPAPSPAAGQPPS